MQHSRLEIQAGRINDVAALINFSPSFMSFKIDALCISSSHRSRIRLMRTSRNSFIKRTILSSLIDLLFESAVSFSRYWAYETGKHDTKSIGNQERR